MKRRWLRGRVGGRVGGGDVTIDLMDGGLRARIFEYDRS